VTGNITASSGTSTVNNLVVNGTANFTNTPLTNISDPSSAQDAATKNYVDTQVAGLVDSAPGTLDTLNELAAALGDDPDFATTITNSIATKLPLAGGTMSGAIAMGTSKITGVGDPTANQDAATKNYTDTQDALKLNLSGGTMSGAIAMGTNKITGAGDPTNAQDVATKNYIDTLFGSTTSAASSASAAATSATNAATSATNAATSETNAATSATNAANSYDAFDDRYLGAKSSVPTLDNDGDALIVGALYFDTNSSTMKVYSSGGWVAAGSSVNGTAERFEYVVGTNSGSYTDSSTTTFPATYDVGFVDVYLNGVKLVTGTDVTVTSGTNVVLTSPAATGDNICIIGYGAFELANFSVSQANDVDLTGNANNAILAYDSTDSRFEPTLTPTLTSLTTTGSITTAGLTTSADINFGDNDKAIFGAGSDLQIYHDGSNSFIRDAGTGNLVIRGTSLNLQKDGGESYITMVADGAVTAYYDNSPKLATTSTGIDVTGRVTSDSLTVDTSTLVVDSTNNRVGVGTTSPSSALETVGGDGITISNSGDTFLQLKTTGTTATNYIEFKDSGGSAGSISYNHTDNYLATKVNGSERLRITNEGDVSIGSDHAGFSGWRVLNMRGEAASGALINFEANDATRRAAIANSSGGLRHQTFLSSQPITFEPNGTEIARFTTDGLTFNGDTAAANALDDYEEGTWTPSFQSDLTTTYTARVGTYTKVGNLVTAWFHLDINVNGATGTQSLIIAGLPFAAINTSENYGSTGGLHCNQWSTSTKPDNALISPGANVAAVYKSNGQAGIQIPTHNDIGNGNMLGFIIYRAT